MKIHRNKVRGLLSFSSRQPPLLCPNFDGPGKTGDLNGFVLAIDEKRDLLANKTEEREGGYFGLFAIHTEDGLRFKLKHYTVTLHATTLSQFFCAIL
jgi:hypothetical protein